MQNRTQRNLDNDAIHGFKECQTWTGERLFKDSDVHSPLSPRQIPPATSETHTVKASTPESFVDTKSGAEEQRFVPNEPLAFFGVPRTDRFQIPAHQVIRSLYQSPQAIKSGEQTAPFGYESHWGLSPLTARIQDSTKNRYFPGFEFVLIGALLSATAIAKPRSGLASFPHLLTENMLPELELVSIEEPKEATDEIEPPIVHQKAERLFGEMARISSPRDLYIIQADDTLVALAETLFNNREVAWLIADINKDRIKCTILNDKRVVELYAGQSIELPANEEADQFLKKRTDHVSQNELVTLVMNVTSADNNSRLIHSVLSKIV